MDKKALHLIQQAGALMQMPRSHKVFLGTTFDTVASHSFHVATIAYVIARMENLSHEDALKSMTMGLFHDLAEARTGDANFITKNYLKIDEDKAIDDQFKNVDFMSDVKSTLDEYEKRDSLISKCTKDADLVEQMYQEWVLAWQGNKIAESWFERDFTNRLPYLFTESAKKLALQMKDSHPNEWWESEFVDKGINYKHLNGRELE